MTLQEKLCRLRSREGLSQEEVAEKLNVSRQSVSKWETGQSVPELEKLLALSELYHVSLDDLAREERDPFALQETVEVDAATQERKNVPVECENVPERTLKQIRRRRGLTVLLTGVGIFFFSLLLLLLSSGSTPLLVVSFYGSIGVAIIGGALMLFHRFHPLLVLGWAVMFGLALFDWLCGWSLQVLRPERCLNLWGRWFEEHYFGYLFYALHGTYFYVLLVLTVFCLWENRRKKRLESK